MVTRFELARTYHTPTAARTMTITNAVTVTSMYRKVNCQRNRRLSFRSLCITVPLYEKFYEPGPHPTIGRSGIHSKEEHQETDRVAKAVDNHRDPQITPKSQIRYSIQDAGQESVQYTCDPHRSMRQPEY